MHIQIHKSHQRSTEFFSVKNFRSFRQQLLYYQIDSVKPPFIELSLKCCGYGYFPEKKKELLDNFLKYLTDAIQKCSQLLTLKIIFNGFDLSNGCFRKIYQNVIKLIKYKQLKTLWLHTTNLRNCDQRDFQNVFKLIEEAGLNDNLQQISVQLADWQFQGGYLSYSKLTQIFTTFASNILRINFKKFRLQISSWYMKEKEAFALLKDSLPENELKQKFSRDSSMQRFTNQAEKRQMIKLLQDYLKNIDYRTETPTYKFKRGDSHYVEADKNQHDQKIQRINYLENQVSKKIKKYPTEHVQKLRVQAFKYQMKNFLDVLLRVMVELQEFHIDLRNWHPSFNMIELKKAMDTKMESGKTQFSFIRKAFSQMNKGKSSEQKTLKTIYTV